MPRSLNLKSNYRLGCFPLMSDMSQLRKCLFKLWNRYHRFTKPLNKSPQNLKESPKQVTSSGLAETPTRRSVNMVSFLMLVLLFVNSSLAGIAPCEKEDISSLVHANCNFTWPYTLNGEEIWDSRLYFKDERVAAYGLDGKEKVEKSYKSRYRLVTMTANETDFCLDDITKDDEGVYERYMYTNTGTRHCKEWNLTVVPATSPNTTTGFPDSRPTTTSRQPSSSQVGGTSNDQQHLETMEFDGNLSAPDDSRVALIAIPCVVVVVTCLLGVGAWYIWRRRGLKNGWISSEEASNTADETNVPLTSSAPAAAV